MQTSRTRRPAAWRHRAALWSLPLLAAALGLSAASGARAQAADAAPGTLINRPDSPGGSGTARVAAPAADRSRDARASELIGMDVRSPRGEHLGEIQDLVVDVNNRRVHYAVLAYGGVLGAGEKLFAYPVRLFRQDGDRDELVLDVSPEQLREWPGFERSRWPNWNDEGTRRQMEQVQGRVGGGSVAIEMQPNMRLVRASELLGRDVNDARGNDAGEIEDLVVNLGDANVRYVVMDFERAWNPNDKLVALPMGAFDFPVREDIDLRLNLERAQLARAPGFDEKRWPDLNDPAWRRRNEGWIGSMGMRENSRDAADNR